VLAPRSKWRREIVPKPRDRRDRCDAARDDEPAAGHPRPDRANSDEAFAQPRRVSRERGYRYDDDQKPTDGLSAIAIAPAPPPGIILLSPNVLSVRHWDRLLGGLLYATSPRVDWPTLPRRSFAVDVLECPKCHGRLRVVAVITEREPVRRILAHLCMPTEAPRVARARDPTDEAVDDESSAQLVLRFA
jgi:hypothetical protein